MSLPPCFILVGRMSPVVIRPSLSPVGMLYGLVLLGKSTGHHVFYPWDPLSTRGSGKFPWILLGSQDVRKNQMNTDLIWEIKAFYEFSTKCLRFEADPSSETLQELQECDRRRVSGWRHTGKPFVFVGHQTLKHSVLENHHLFWDFLNMVMCVCVCLKIVYP